MAIYSINDLEQLSGIKAHTLRVWEQRYGIIVPQRTPTNIRFYTDNELRKLLNISLLNKHGYKISRIVNMTDSDIVNAVEELARQHPEYDTHIDTLAISMVEMDEQKFEQIVGSRIFTNGFEATMIDTIFPFLDKINLLYLTGSIKPAQEHFVTILIRQKVIAAIDAIPLASRQNATKFLIFLPEGERQELTLLYLHYILKSRGFQVVNLGINLSTSDLEVGCELLSPHYIYTIFTEQHKQSVAQRVESICSICADIQVLLSGYLLENQIFTLPANARVLRDLETTLAFLKNL